MVGFTPQNYRCYKGAWIYSHDLHLESKLSDKEIAGLLSKGGLMVRNVYDFDCKEETSFWYVIKDTFGGFEELSPRKRTQVRKCFKTLRVEKITANYILEKGYDVYVSAAESYKVKAVPPTREEFESRIRHSDENEYWGCIENATEKLVAFSMNIVTEDCAEYRTLKAIPEYMRKHNAFYGLIFEMNRYYLEERKLKYVNDGSRTITNHSNIQLFLIDVMKFRKAYCHLSIKYKWWLGMAVCMLYPFRKLIPLRQVKALLDMEAMARGEI